MRITALRQLSKSPASPAAGVTTPDPLPAAARAAIKPRLVRCECRDCGAHCNAIAALDVHASCPNCGASRLVPVEGASVILAAQRN